MFPSINDFQFKWCPVIFNHPSPRHFHLWYLKHAIRFLSQRDRPEFLSIPFFNERGFWCLLKISGRYFAPLDRGCIPAASIGVVLLPVSGLLAGQVLTQVTLSGINRTLHPTLFYWWHCHSHCDEVCQGTSVVGFMLGVWCAEIVPAWIAYCALYVGSLLTLQVALLYLVGKQFYTRLDCRCYYRVRISPCKWHRRQSSPAAVSDTVAVALICRTRCWLSPRYPALDRHIQNCVLCLPCHFRHQVTSDIFPCRSISPILSNNVLPWQASKTLPLLFRNWYWW